ncbi:MAG: hypothetical protein ACRDQ0_04255, partial [Pseudonocardia sp.]
VLGWVTGPGSPSRTTKAVLAALVVSAPLNYRYVKNRKVLNRELGMDTRPRWDAWRGAGLAALVAAVQTVVQLDQYHWLFVGVAFALGTAVQRRQVGGQLTWNAVFEGLYAIPITLLVVEPLEVGSVPHGERDYLASMGAWMLAAVPGALIIDYAIHYVSVPTQKVSLWLQRKVRRSAERHGSKTSKARLRWTLWWQRVLDHRRQDFDTFGPPDWLISTLKVPDSVLKALLIFWIVSPMPGFRETGPAVLVRVAVAAAVVAGTWVLRNRRELVWKALGYLSSRSMTRRPREIRPWRRVTRRIRPLDRTVRSLLAATGSDRSLKPGEQPAEVARQLVEIVGLEPPDPAELRTLADDFPMLRHDVDVALHQRKERHKQHGRALALAMVLMATDREALRGAVGRTKDRGDRWASDLRFLDAVLAELLTPQNLGRLPLNGDDLALLELSGTEVGPILRTVWEPRLIDALHERRTLRLANLGDLLKRLSVWRARLGPAAYTDHQRLRADGWIQSVDGQLKHELGRSIDARGFVAARHLISARRRSVKAVPEAERDDTVRKLAAALDLMDTAMAVVDEVQLHKRERRNWRGKLAEALVDESLSSTSLLALLLTLAGADGRVTGTSLANTHPGNAASTWQRKLTALAGIGVISGSPTEGYTASDALRTAWRDADPRLRHAMLRNPTLLPGAGALAPLTRASATDQAEARRAHAVLLDVLATAELVLSYHTPGVLDDLTRKMRRHAGRRYQRRHPESAVDQASGPDRRARAATRAAVKSELRAAIQEVEQETRAWRVAIQSETARYRPGTDVHTAGPNAPPTTGRRDPTTADVEQLHRAHRRLSVAAETLREIAARIRAEDYPEPRARPASVSQLLVKADHVLDHGPSRASSPPAAFVLRRAVAALGDADRALRRAAHDPEALWPARLALAGFREAATAAREAKTAIQMINHVRLTRGERRA